MSEPMEIDEQLSVEMIQKRSRAETIHSLFSSFGSELDSHYDRRERINKLSKDITALSKKLIFTLHRITSKDRASTLREADGRLGELRVLFERLQCEVEGENFWRYERQVSGGVQEYLEGLTFYHFVFNHSIPSLSVCQEALSPLPQPSTSQLLPTASTSLPSPSEEMDNLPHLSDNPVIEGGSIEVTTEDEEVAATLPPYVMITVEDYLGGIADLTGELMRLAIGSVGRSLSTGADGESEDGVSSIASIGRTVREIKGEMDPLAPFARWLPKKLVVLDQSLEKIEKASYGLRIREGECRGSPAMLAMLASRLAAGGGAGGGD